MNVLLFGGTIEGRILAQRLAEAGHLVTCCVATDYGRGMLAPQPNLSVRVGRMDQDVMTIEMSKGYDCVVDATHPYAIEVSKKIREAAQSACIPYERLVRPRETAENVIWADSPIQAAELLTELPGNILLTTGCKDLVLFAHIPDFAQRIWIRILPSMESLQTALDLGYPASHIICMQGPFSQEMNIATLRSMEGKVLVTKDTGLPGGFNEKVAAAREAGAKLLAIRRPVQETGIALDKLLEKMTEGVL